MKDVISMVSTFPWFVRGARHLDVESDPELLFRQLLSLRLHLKGIQWDGPLTDHMRVLVERTPFNEIHDALYWAEDAVLCGIEEMQLNRSN
jgi:hypothetical protein